MSSFATERTEYGNDDTRWLRDALRAESHGVTIDGSLFTSDAAGILVPSGTHVSDLGGPYNATTEEVQTVTVTGGPTGGTFTLTFSGQTTTALAFNVSAADMQTALEALSNIAPGDVSVVKASNVYTVSFDGALANTNVAQFTSTPSLTGGTSPSVTHATTTAGGAGVDSPSGSGKTAGHLRNRMRIKPGRKYLVAVVHAGTVDRRYLPSGDHDAAAEAQLTAVAYIN